MAGVFCAEDADGVDGDGKGGILCDLTKKLARGMRI